MREMGAPNAPPLLWDPPPPRAGWIPSSHQLPAQLYVFNPSQPKRGLGQRLLAGGSKQPDWESLVLTGGGVSQQRWSLWGFGATAQAARCPLGGTGLGVQVPLSPGWVTPQAQLSPIRLLGHPQTGESPFRGAGSPPKLGCHPPGCRAIPCDRAGCGDNPLRCPRQVESSHLGTDLSPAQPLSDCPQQAEKHPNPVPTVMPRCHTAQGHPSVTQHRDAPVSPSQGHPSVTQCRDTLMSPL